VSCNFVIGDFCFAVILPERQSAAQKGKKTGETGYKL
jgi:hypothetical protein